MRPLHFSSKELAESNCHHAAVEKNDESEDDNITSGSSISASEVSMTMRGCDENEADDRIGVLNRAIQDRNWGKVVSRATAHPEEASRWIVTSCLPNKRPERLLALHYACSLGAPAEVIKALIEADPNVVRRPDQSGRTLLHWAADHLDSSIDVFRTILSLHPEGARVREHKYGCTALHVACCRKQPRSYDGEIINLLLEAFPEAALCRDKRKGWLPLHVATRNGASPAVIQALTVACPTSAAIGDNDTGRLPLHYVARYADMWQIDELESIVTALVESYPAGLKRRERKRGHTPLAIACSTRLPPKTLKVIVSLLLEHDQAAISIPDFGQSLPIHIGSRAHAPFVVMRDLLIANPMAAVEQDKNGRTALHWACQMDATAEIIDLLLRVNPTGAGVTESKYGFTPLVVALHRHAEVAVIQTLLAFYPKAARFKDKHGSLPLHVACKKPGSNTLDVIGLLAKAYPESMKIKDRNGRTPLDVFMSQCQCSNPDSAVLAVLGADVPTNTPSVTSTHTATPAVIDPSAQS